jgi:hypothetical protein
MSDDFVTAYEEIAAKSEKGLAAVKRKFAAQVRRVVYQDLVSTIWSLWQVPPDDVTVNHIAHALNLLARESEGGVELDRVSSEACGIDYARLVTLMQASRGRGTEMAAGPKVPKKSAIAATTSPPASEVAQSPVAKAEPERVQETGAATVPAGPRKRGRPAKIDAARKEAALAARERGETWRDVARLLYDNKYPTARQMKNASNILKQYKRSRTPPGNS